ncbi:MAG: hypothetical protein IKT97_01535 [Spirochaetia bacterium]|nr:hypothetical protein [Spirochaetia bacterium]
MEINKAVCFVQYGKGPGQEPEVIEERLGKNFIRILLYETTEKKWHYSSQVFVHPIIRAFYPDKNNNYRNRAEALAAAKKEIRQLLESTRQTKKMINDFPVMFQNQLEFDFS